MTYGTVEYWKNEVKESRLLKNILISYISNNTDIDYEVTTLAKLVISAESKLEYSSKCLADELDKQRKESENEPVLRPCYDFDEDEQERNFD